jgi:CarD family transcriptional regulator
MLETLRVGDKMIYPAQGAGVIEGIEKKVISGAEHLFYVMRIYRNGAKIMIPMTKMQSVGIRKPISSEEVARVYDILGESEGPAPEPARPAETWNRRYSRYKLLIKSGTVHELAVILKALHHTNKTRALSLGERIISEKAMDLLVGELMCARDMEEKAVRSEIGNLLKDE